MLSLNPSAPAGSPSALTFLLTSPPVVVTPPVTTGGTLMYCTLPLGLGTPGSLGQAVSPMIYKQHQTSPRLRLVLLDANGVPINLTGALSVTLRLSPTLGGGGAQSFVMTVKDAELGIVDYTFQSADVAAVGSFHLEVEAVMADGTTMYFPSDGYMSFVIRASLGQ